MLSRKVLMVDWSLQCFSVLRYGSMSFLGGEGCCVTGRQGFVAKLRTLQAAGFLFGADLHRELLYSPRA